MQINRAEFLKAVKFLLPALGKEPDDITNWMHVKVTKDLCILTAGNGICGKRVILIRDLTIEDAIIPHIDQEFLIPKSIIESFETLCKKHKTRFMTKKDPSFKLIEIYQEELKSHKNIISYSQPPKNIKYPDIEKYFGTSFWQDANPYDRTIFARSKNVIDALKEFDGNVQIRFPGGNAPVLLTEDKESISFMAFFLPEIKKEATIKPLVKFENKNEEIIF